MATSGFNPAMLMAGSGGGRGPFNYQPGSYANIFGGLFSNPDRPYREAQQSLQQMMPQAQSYNQPFLQAGTRAIPRFENWLGGMSNPSGFINNLMGQYSESPWAKYQQDQSARAFGNAGSAGGMTGSTPLLQFQQQNMHDLSSQDMNQWLQNVLGVNTQYGAGTQNLMLGGQNAANNLQSLMRDYMGANAGLEFGKSGAREGKMGSLIGGLTGLFGL